MKSRGEVTKVGFCGEIFLRLGRSDSSETGEARFNGGVISSAENKDDEGEYSSGGEVRRRRERSMSSRVRLWLRS